MLLRDSLALGNLANYLSLFFMPLPPFFEEPLFDGDDLQLRAHASGG